MVVKTDSEIYDLNTIKIHGCFSFVFSVVLEGRAAENIESDVVTLKIVTTQKS